MQGLKSRPDCLWQQGHIDVGDIFYLEDYYTVVLYMSIIATFVLLIVIRSLERHKKRDLEWMESLIEYAKFDGKDTKGLECVRSELPAIMKPNYVWVAFVVTGSRSQRI